jgi:integrase
MSWSPNVDIRPREADLPASSPEDARDGRHSYATAALAAGVPAKVVSERLGQANIAITMDTYSHVLPGMHERNGARRGKPQTAGETG